jgi:CubicO group peptidase (beta-lactamase class C family)
MRNLILLAALFTTSGRVIPASSDVVDRYVRSEMNRQSIPGLQLVVVQNGKIVKTAAYGLANVEHRVPVTTRTRFRLDSFNKVFTATAILQLAEEGKLRLDDSASRYLDPTPSSWRGITIRHLLSHTSGIQDDYSEEFHGSMLVEYQASHLSEYARTRPVEFKAGERVAYNNLAYFLLTLVIERVTGMPYCRYIEQRILIPLKMLSSGCPDMETIVPDLAAPYAMHDHRLVHMRGYMVSQAGYSYAMNATAQDIARFDLALDQGRVLKPHIREQMWTRAKLLDGSSIPFSLGWLVSLHRGSRFMSKGGRSGTIYSKYPEQKLSVIILANLDANTGDVSYQGLANAVAGMFNPELASPRLMQPQRDPKPELTARLRTVLVRFAEGHADPTQISPQLIAAFPPGSLTWLGLSELKSFSFVVCDEVRPPWESFGTQVRRNCYYRLGFPNREETMQLGLGENGIIGMINIE